MEPGGSDGGNLVLAAALQRRAAASQSGVPNAEQVRPEDKVRRKFRGLSPSMNGPQKRGRSAPWKKSNILVWPEPSLLEQVIAKLTS